MKQLKMLQIIGLAMVMIMPFHLHAKMYKWVDENGVTQYTQYPPPEQGIEVETIKPPPPVNTEAAQKELQDLENKIDSAKDARNSSEEEAVKSEQDQAQKQAECNKAKARLASYQRPRVNKVLPDGTRVRIPEEERLSEIEKSKELIKKACN